MQDGVWQNDMGSIWIKDRSNDLHLRICAIGHTGPSGHGGMKSTESTIRLSFWSTMSEDIQMFVRLCVQCLSSTGGGKAPRPFGTGTHVAKPNHILQFDCIEIGPSHSVDKYILIKRDDHSDYN